MEPAEALAEALGMSLDEAREVLSKKRLVRVMRYRSVRYIALRRDYHGFEEGTCILFGRAGVKVVRGYPSIKRVLVLKSAVPSHFPDKVVVEEKMNGYNVRVVEYDGMILAITRGGYICPYTTARLNSMYGDRLACALEALGEEGVLCGEVVGLENPYTRYEYPEAPRFDFFVFDARVGERFLPLPERDKIVEEAGLRRVPVHGVFNKDDVSSIKQVVDRLEAEGREGIVLKDPLYRVPPLKYTTTATNIGDLEVGMLYPFDEGHQFLFSRILREIYKCFEEGLGDDELRARARRLGEAILLPAVKALREAVEGMGIHEEFTLRFPSTKELGEFLEYMLTLNVPVADVRIVEEKPGEVVVRMKKMKSSPSTLRKLAATGLSPID